MDSKKGLIAAIIVLALALIGSLIWGFNKNSQTVSLAEQNSETTAALDAMTALRDQLAREVDSLAGEYDLLASENTELNGKLAGSRDELANAQAALSKAKRNSTAQVNDLRAQIEALTAARGQLEGSISALQTENASLREQMGILETNLSESRQQNEQLSSMATSMESEIKKLTYDNFKASAFQVTPEVSRGNPTAKSGRAKRVVVSFDVANVPAEFQGVRPLFLVITDDKGTPIPRTDYIRTSVTVNGQRQDLMAVEAREENIGATQRISFTHTLENKLDAGYYRASVYTDLGFLGSSQFRMQ